MNILNRILPVYNRWFYFCKLYYAKCNRLNVPNIKNKYVSSIASNKDLDLLLSDPYTVQYAKNKPAPIANEYNIVSVVKHKDKIIGYCQTNLIENKHVCETGYNIIPDKPTVWGYNFNIDYRYRSGKAFLALCEAANLAIDKLNADSLITEINADNTKSLNSFKRMGHNTFNTVYCVALFNTRLFYTLDQKKFQFISV